MDGNHLDYDALLRRALLGMVRDILRDTAENGLRGEHHYFIAFSTTHPGVVIPESLSAKHPKDMTIVLQNQFWDLLVGDQQFSVKLNFSGRTEQLTIPFDALLGFLDPSVQFALPFREHHPGAAREPVRSATEHREETAEPVADGANEDNVVALDSFRRQ